MGKTRQIYGSRIEKIVTEFVWLYPVDQGDSKAGAQRIARKILWTLNEQGYLSEKGRAALAPPQDKERDDG